MKPPLITLLTDKMHKLHVQLQASRAQPADAQNPEALHTLRVSLRQLHSLLLPLSPQLSKAAELDLWVKKSMKLTNPIRDREVLILELRRLEQTVLADAYMAKLQEDIQQVYPALPLQIICAQLHVLPEYWAKKLSPAKAKQLAKHIAKNWLSTRRKLLKAMQHKTPDKHRLRILTKELRYNSETYAAILPKKARIETARLKQLQDILGTWHDASVWLEMAPTHPELERLVPIWQQDLANGARASDQRLVLLKHEWSQ
jgi:CHAD domain-containing protein